MVSPARYLASIFALLLGAGASAATSCHGAETPSAAAPYLREFGYFTTSGGTRLAYVAYRPRGVDRAPVVFTYDPYLGGGGDPEPTFLDAGYAYVAMSVAGTGCSQGAMGFMHGDEIGQGVEAVAWLARRGWSDGRVAMWGYSYPGHTAALIAARNPPALKAIAVGSLTTDWYRDNAYPGGIPNIGIMARWPDALQPRLEKLGRQHRLEWGDAECAKNTARRSPNRLFATMLLHPAEDNWWRDIALDRHVADSRVPTLLTHNWQDHLTFSGDRLFAELNAPKRILLMPGGHSYAQVEPEVQAATISWFDHWVRGVPNGADRAPAATVLWEVQRSGAPSGWSASWTTSYASWPVPGSEHRTYGLGANGELDAPGDTPSPGARRYVYPLGTELANDADHFALMPDPLGVAAYVTAPLASDLTILGEPKVRLRLSADQSATDIMVVLHDIHPDGSTQFLLRGFARASLGGKDVRTVVITLPSLGAVLRRGHRLELAIMSPPVAPSPDWAFALTDKPGYVTVSSEADAPSILDLPVVPTVASLPPIPPCGSQAFQPCRKSAAR